VYPQETVCAQGDELAGVEGVAIDAGGRQAHGSS